MRGDDTEKRYKRERERTKQHKEREKETERRERMVILRLEIEECVENRESIEWKSLPLASLASQKILLALRLRARVSLGLR
eukprot:1250165-Amorphochlora_amoeboformis.AAC.1